MRPEHQSMNPPITLERVTQIRKEIIACDHQEALSGAKKGPNPPFWEILRNRTPEQKQDFESFYRKITP